MSSEFGFFVRNVFTQPSGYRILRFAGFFDGFRVQAELLKLQRKITRYTNHYVGYNNNVTAILPKPTNVVPSTKCNRCFFSRGSKSNAQFFGTLGFTTGTPFGQDGLERPANRFPCLFSQKNSPRPAAVCLFSSPPLSTSDFKGKRGTSTAPKQPPGFADASPKTVDTIVRNKL